MTNQQTTPKKNTKHGPNYIIPGFRGGRPRRATGLAYSALNAGGSGGRVKKRTVSPGLHGQPLWCATVDGGFHSNLTPPGRSRPHCHFRRRRSWRPTGVAHCHPLRAAAVTPSGGGSGGGLVCLRMRDIGGSGPLPVLADDPRLGRPFPNDFVVLYNANGLTHTKEAHTHRTTRPFGLNS